MSDEEDGPRDAAGPEETALEHQEPTDDAETEFRPFDEVDEDFKPGPLALTRDEMGTFSQIDQSTESDIPALSLSSLICLGDFSKFAIRGPWGEIVCTLDPSDVERSPNGTWRASVELVLERSKLRILQERQKHAELRKRFKSEITGAEQNQSDQAVFLSMLLRPGQPGTLDPEWIGVEPIRPPCEHFVRQQGSFHLNQKHRKYYRLCSARRTTEGTFMTVSDTGVYACDMREPYDAPSAKLLDDFDAMKIEEGKNRVYLPMLSQERSPASNGIFDGPSAQKD